jgi:hypothetical protein
MCLTVNKLLTEEQKKKRKGFIVRYKVLAKHCVFLENGENGTLQLVSPYFTKKVWEPGWILSNRKKSAFKRLPGEINKGIHVYKTKKGATKSTDGDYDVVLPVRCHADDLVACNEYEEVYYKVLVSERAYKKLIKE